jgi:hypothetical protein
MTKNEGLINLEARFIAFFTATSQMDSPSPEIRLFCGGEFSRIFLIPVLVHVDEVTLY